MKRPRGEETGTRRPTAKDFTAGAVQKAVFSETVQNAVTIIPAAVSAVFLLYFVYGFAALKTFDLASFTVSLVTGLFSLGAWAFNYFVRGEELAKRHIQKLMKQREQYRQIESTSLEEECRSLGFNECAQAVLELREAYQNLRGFLLGKGSTDLNAQRFIVLAEDTYNQGVNILIVALETHKVLQRIDATKLEKEIEKWSRELRGLEKNGDERDKARIDALSKKIESNEKRLKLYQNRQDMLEKLLAQCEELEAALCLAYLEVIDLGEKGGVTLRSGESASRLERAVNAARQVEERLKSNLSGTSSKEDEIYLEAGSKSRKS